MGLIPKIKKERVCVYIDGSNFYKYLKDKEINFPKGLKFNYKALIDSLVGDQRECVSKRYYIGILRNINNTQKNIELIKGQQKFLSEIEKDGFITKRSRILFYSDGIYKEKGTDVKIA